VTPIHRGAWRIDPIVRDGVRRPLPIAVSRLATAIASALDAGGAPRPGSVGLVLSDDAELAELNATHLDHDGPTDVLSFPMLPPEAFPPHDGRSAHAREPVAPSPAAFTGRPGGRVLIGDIVVSIERAIDQARAGRGGQTGDVRWSARDELRLLVTHGALHLCGWDHAEPAEEAAMRALERTLLANDR